MELTDLTALGLEEEKAQEVLVLCRNELEAARLPGPTLDSGLQHGGAPAAGGAATLREALEQHYSR